MATTSALALDFSQDSFWRDFVDFRIPHETWEETSFHQRYRTWGIQLAHYGIIALFLCLLLWWPLDWVVFRHDESLIAAFSTLRTHMLIGLAGAYLMLRLLWRWQRGWLEQWGSWVVVLQLSAGSAYISHFFSGLGGPEGPYFQFTYFLPVLSCVFVGGISARILSTALVVLTVILAYFGSNPAHLASPAAPFSISYFCFLGLLSTFIGWFFQKLLLGNYVCQLRLDGVKAELRQLNLELESRVAYQTRELRALARNIEDLREEERTWIAQELHDGLGQEMTAMRVSLALARRVEDADSQRACLGDLEQLVARATSTMRRVLKRLRPRVLDELGLTAALQWLAEDTGTWSRLRCRFEGPERPTELPRSYGTALFRIAQEALNNVLRHAQAQEAVITLAAGEAGISLSIADDGRGFRQELAGEALHMGLLGMEERARSLGGRAAFGSSPLGGAQVSVCLPLPEVSEDEGSPRAAPAEEGLP